MNLAPPEQGSSPLAVFQNRSFRLLWTAQFISATGSSFTMLASSILVYRLTGSALSVGLMLIATALPTLLVGLAAGVVVDRFDRRKIMLAADITRAVLVFLIPFLVPHSVVWLYILVMLSAAVTQFYEPANASLLPELASEEQLGAANSLLAASSLGSTAIGFAASGLIASSLPIEWAFYVDSLSFLVSAVCILGIRVAPFHPEEDTRVAAVLHNLRAGIEYIRRTTVLRSLFLVYLPVFVSIGLLNALLLPFAERALGATEFEFGLLSAAEAIGYLLGSLLLAKYADRLHEGQWLAISFIGMAIPALLFAFISGVPAGLALMAASGALNMPSVVGRDLIIQRNTTREVRGRVFSAFFVARDAIFVAGMALAGLADFVNIRALYFAGGLLILLGGLGVLALPGLKQPAAEWRRAIALLRGTRTGPRLGAGRPATLADIGALAVHLPPLGRLAPDRLAWLAANTRVVACPAGTTIIRRGETSDAAYFLMQGRTVAGWDEEGGFRPLQVHRAGDFFGEIAALTGAPRTANVVAQEDTLLIEASSPTIREMMQESDLRQLFLAKLMERLNTMNMVDLPSRYGMDPRWAAELRMPAWGGAVETAAPAA